MNWFNVITHGIGATVGAATLYDIGTVGYSFGKAEAVNELGQDYTDLFKKSQTSSFRSIGLEKAKSRVRDKFFDNEYYPIVKNVKNVILTTAEEALHHVVALASVGAIFKCAFSHSRSAIVKRVIPAVAAGILAVKALKVMAVDVMEIGKN